MTPIRLSRTAEPLRGPSRRGFTLVELLVVIGIIAMLVSILLPTLSSARESAKATKCLSNMRQVAVAFSAYAIENRGVTPVQTNPCVDDYANPAVYDTPTASNWSCLASLMPYLNGDNVARVMYVCPTAIEGTWSGGEQANAISETNYLTNLVPLGRKITRISDSSEIVILQEDRFRWRCSWLRPCLLSAASGTTPAKYGAWCFNNGPPWGQEYTYLHKKGGNLAFVDGHAEWRHGDALHPSDFGLVGIPGTSDTQDPNIVPQSMPYYCAFD